MFTRTTAMLLCCLGLALPALFASGCNTVKGFGKDIHDGTQEVQEWMEGDSMNSNNVGQSARR